MPAVRMQCFVFLLCSIKLGIMTNHLKSLGFVILLLFVCVFFFKEKENGKLKNMNRSFPRCNDRKMLKTWNKDLLSRSDTFSKKNIRKICNCYTCVFSKQNSASVSFK